MGSSTWARCVLGGSVFAVTVGTAAIGVAQVQSPYPNQQLQGQVQQNNNPSTYAGQVSYDQGLCSQTAPGVGYAGSDPCIALGFQIAGTNKDRACIPLITAALAAAVAQRAYGNSRPTPSPASAQRIQQLQAAKIDALSALYSEGCLNLAPGTPHPPQNAIGKPFACQAYWNSWYVDAVSHCQASGASRDCFDKANTEAKGGVAMCAKPPPSSVPYPPQQVYPPLQQASEFSNYMRAAAEQMLQSAGRISKAMTDANDVTRHNNVGVGIALGGMFGAVAQNFREVASLYQGLAAAGHAAGDEAAVMQIATTAAAESQTLAGQAEQAASQLRAAGPQMADAVPAGSDSLGHYLENAVADLTPATAQGALPTCTLLSCYRLAQLLGKNVSLFDVLTKYPPAIIFKVIQVLNDKGQLVDKVILEDGGGLNVYEIQHLVLQRLGIQTQAGSDINLMLNEIRANKPILAYVKTVSMPPNIRPVGTPSGPFVPDPLHGVVIERLEMQGNVPGLRIYDPGGWSYWQPTATFRKYFANIYLTPQ